MQLPNHLFCALIGAAFLLSAPACHRRTDPLSGTIEVDEVHVAPRSPGRVEEILAQEGDHLHPGQLIVRLEAAELRARRDLAQAQIDTAIQDADAQAAQLEFMRADARRQQDLLKSRTVSPNEAERARSAAAAQEKSLEAARMRIVQSRAQLAETEAQMREMQIVAPNDCVLEVLNVKVGDVLAPNQEVATLLLPQHL